MPFFKATYMSPDDFIRIALKRGKKLWLLPSIRWGVTCMTDGVKSYPLPRFLPDGLMDSELVGDLLSFFFEEDNIRLLAVDFHLDPKDDD
jgi:hypothetical protein